MHYTLSSRSRAIMYQKYPSFLAPQTEIPLTGEMSRSDKRVTARYEQLEPVTGQEYCRATVLGADVALCISSCSPHPFFCHRQRGTVSQLTAAFRYCNTVSQARELCRGADRNKKTAHRAIFLFGASNRARTCDTAVNSRVLCQLSY